MTNIELAERALADLEGQRQALIEQRQRDDAQMKAIAYLAHAQHDREAGQQLRELRERAVRHDQKATEIEAAIAEADKRLQAAQAAAVRAQDRKRARRVWDLVARMCERGPALDGALATFAEQAEGLRRDLDEIRALGSPFPRPEQVEVLGYEALLTVLKGTVWARRFEPISSVRHKQFAELIRAWAATIENGVIDHLGDEQPATKKTEAA